MENRTGVSSSVSISHLVKLWTRFKLTYIHSCNIHSCKQEHTFPAFPCSCKRAASLSLFVLVRWVATYSCPPCTYLSWAGHLTSAHPCCSCSFSAHVPHGVHTTHLQPTKGEGQWALAPWKPGTSCRLYQSPPASAEPGALRTQQQPAYQAATSGSPAVPHSGRAAHHLSSTFTSSAHLLVATPR